MEIKDLVKAAYDNVKGVVIFNEFDYAYFGNHHVWLIIDTSKQN